MALAGRQSYAQTCKYPGCTKPCYREPYGRVHDFCGRTHAEEYRKKYGSYYSVGYAPHLQGGTPHTPGYKLTPVSSKSKTPSSSLQPVRANHNLPAQSYSQSTFPGRSQKIKFYNRDEPFYEFTNFYPCSVRIDGHTWPTTEHYFQAQKFVGTPYVECIRRLHQPREAFQLSRDPKVSRWRRSDWESVKDDVMLKALRVKFSDENPRLVSRLLSTGDKELIEHTSNDSYWGDGGNGTGSNKLGQLLMQVRSELRAKRGTSVAPAVGMSQDDSALSQTRERSKSPSGSSLKRSGSFSTSRGTRGSTPPRQPSYPSSYPSSGYPARHSGTRHSTQSPIPDTLKKSAKAVKHTATLVVSKAATAATTAANIAIHGGSSSQSTSHQPHAYNLRSQGTAAGSRGRGNASSVPYNIINHKVNYKK